MGKRFVECFLVRRKRDLLSWKKMKTQNVYHFQEHWSVRNPPVSLVSVSLMVITDGFENSSKSLFPYDQYEMSKSIYAIAAITLN